MLERPVLSALGPLCPLQKTVDECREEGSLSLRSGERKPFPSVAPLSRLVYPTGAQLGRSDRVAGRALVLFRKNPPCVHPLAHRTKGLVSDWSCVPAEVGQVSCAT